MLQGLFGGLEGACFKSTIARTDGSVTEMPSKGSAALVHKGDRVLIRCGGYGDPLDREPECVLQEVVDAGGAQPLRRGAGRDRPRIRQDCDVGIAPAHAHEAS